MTVVHSGSPGGGVFLLCWGLFATPVGGLLATNYRGFAEHAATSGPRLRRLPERRPSSMVPFMRILGGVFAVIGALTLVLGLVFTLQGHGGLLLHTRQPQGVTALIYPAMAVFSLFQFWRPRGLLRQAWSRGARASATGVTLGTVLFPIGFGLGFPVLAVVALVGGSLAGLPLAFPARRT